MCSGPAHHVALPRQSDPCSGFLADAASNLAVVRDVFGSQSTRYQRIVEHYLFTADELGCRPGIEQVLASLTPPSEANPSR